jgi:hypothetical protein
VAGGSDPRPFVLASLGPSNLASPKERAPSLVSLAPSGGGVRSDPARSFSDPSFVTPSRLVPLAPSYPSREPPEGPVARSEGAGFFRRTARARLVPACARTRLVRRSGRLVARTNRAIRRSGHPLISRVPSLASRVPSESRPRSFRRSGSRRPSLVSQFGAPTPLYHYTTF